MQIDFIELNQNDIPSVAAQAEHSDGSARERTATRMGGRKTDKSGTKSNLSKSNIIVRLPVDDDREAVRALARKLHSMTIFSDIEFSDAKFDRQFGSALRNTKHNGCLVAELGGRIIGLALVTAGEHHIGIGEILTTVHVLGIDEDLCGTLVSGKTFLRLIQAIKKWGELRGATRTLVHVTTGSNLAVTDRLMQASGAKFIGGGYVVWKNICSKAVLLKRSADTG